MDIPVFTQLAVKQFLPQRKQHSHKGANGKVVIVGGSLEYHGSPLLSGLAALRSGCDMVFLIVPESIHMVIRAFLPDFIVRTYPGEALSMKSISPILESVDECDVLLLGPGLGHRKETRDSAIEILTHVTKPIVIDAQAILPYSAYKTFKSPGVIFTPHVNELERLMDNFLKKETLEENLQAFCRLYNYNVLLKGYQDLIVTQDGKLSKNETGNPGMTCGGTGDVLAGVVAGLLSQKLNVFEAMHLGAYVVGKAGDMLYSEKGYGYIAHEVADRVANALFTLYE